MHALRYAFRGWYTVDAPRGRVTWAGSSRNVDIRKQVLLFSHKHVKRQRSSTHNRRLNNYVQQ
jgi:hypothetical protein